MIKKLWMVFVILCCIFLTSCKNSDTEEVWLTDVEEITQEESHLVENSSIFVYICGEVNKPGVYELMDSQRVYELIEMAGGLTDKADLADLNQAIRLTDGEKIYVKSLDETRIEKENEQTKTDGRVNINKAGISELEAIPGIGESRAGAIVQYRKEHGNFKDIKEIMQVSGIKEGLYEKIKDKIKTD